MIRRHYLSRTFAGAAAIALLGACSGASSVQVQGSDVVNAEDVLTTADDMFTNHLSEIGGDGVVTSSDDSRCYYLPEGEGDNVRTELFCGPVRVLDVEDSHWLPLAATAGTTDDGLTLDVSGAGFGEPTSVDGERLFRPDDAEPVAVDSLPEPQAPEAPVSDFAVMAGSDDDVAVQAEFEVLSEQYVLRTPSMTVTVEGVAEEVPRLDAGLVELAGGGTEGPDSGDAGSGDAGSKDTESEDTESEDTESEDTESDGSEDSESEGSDLYSPSSFRPAEGQTVRAWRLTVSAPVGIAGDSEASWLSAGPEADGHDASGSIVVQAGSEQLDIAGGPRTDDGTAGVDCVSAPCEVNGDGEYVLVTSSSGGDAPELVVTTDGVEQTLSLADGTATTPMSTVTDSREQLSAEVSTAWDTQSVTLAETDQLNEDLTDWAWGSDLTFTFGGGIEEAHLTSFDATRGWAAEGKAWLVVPVVGDPRELAADMNLTTGGPGSLSLDESVWSLQAGDQTVPGVVAFPEGEEDAWTAQRVIFEVGDTFSQGAITYQPAGSVDFSNGVSYPLETGALTAEVAIAE